MDNATPYPSLLAPFTLAGQRLKNRVVHASMTTRMGENMRVTDRLIQYHANRARGGAAILVTEPLSMARHQNIEYKVRAWNDDDLEGLTRWAAAVRAHDSHLLGQIQDSGRGRHVPGRNPDALGASALPDDISWTVPHTLTVAEIEQMIEDFAQSRRAFSAAGSAASKSPPATAISFTSSCRRARTHAPTNTAATGRTARVSSPKSSLQSAPPAAPASSSASSCRAMTARPGA